MSIAKSGSSGLWGESIDGTGDREIGGEIVPPSGDRIGIQAERLVPEPRIKMPPVPAAGRWPAVAVVSAADQNCTDAAGVHGHARASLASAVNTRRICAVLIRR